MQWQQYWAEFAGTFDWIYLSHLAGQIILIIVGFHLLARLADSVVDRSIDVSGRRAISEEETRRKETLRGVIKSLLRYAIDIVAVLTILPSLNVPIAQFLAGAGVVGLAVGFGAQHLVRDVVSGFFILFENQFTVGDYIEAAGQSGIVEEMGLRITRMRDFGGQVHFIPNGKIEQLTNHSRGTMRVLVDVGIAYEENVDWAVEVLDRLCEEMAQDMDILHEGPDVLGVTELGDSSVNLRVRARAVSMQQWNAEREIRRRIKQRFDEQGVEIPYPRRVVVPAGLTKVSNIDGSGETEMQTGSSADKPEGGGSNR